MKDLKCGLNFLFFYFFGFKKHIAQEISSRKDKTFAEVMF